MTQSVLAIPNEPGANFRADVNTALQAIASQQSGATAPTTTYPYQFWQDTTLNLLKMRNGANSAWVIIGPLADSTQNILYTNNTGQTYTDSTGKTGFGVPVPGYKVDVSGDANVTGAFRVAGVAQTNAARSTIASASTTDLGSVNSSGITISGTVAITSFGTMPAGIIKYVTLSGAVPITYNATSMITPTGANITGAVGDTFIVESLGSGNSRIHSYFSPNGGNFTAMNGGQLAGFRNVVINGNFNIWQRGTTSALSTSAAYASVDRWQVYQSTAAAGIANRDTSITAGLGFRYGMKFGRNASSTGTGEIGLVQTIETANALPLAGQTVTLSYYAKKGANYSAASNGLGCALITGTGVDENATSFTGSANAISATDTLTTSWQRFQHNVTLGSSITELGVKFYWNGVGTAGADDNVYITGVQLEIGAVATPFENRSFGIELALCQRYYLKTFPYATAPVQNSAVDSLLEVVGQGTNQTAGICWAFPVTMRTAPTVTLYSPNAANANWSLNGNTPTATVNRIQDCGIALRATTAITAGAAYYIHATASAEL